MSEAGEGARAGAVRVLAAGTLYFGAVFAAGFVLGPLRVLWLEPRLGEAAATAIELPFLAAAMMVAARIVTAWLDRSAQGAAAGALICVGLVAVVLLNIADAGVGLLVRGYTPAALLVRLATPAGLLYLAAQALFAAMPVLVGRPRARRHRGPG